MKKITLIFMILTGMYNASIGQMKGPITGSGKLIKKFYDYKNFDKLNLYDLDGKIDVEIGKQYSVYIEIDDNLFPLLKTELNKEENELSIFLDGNKNNRLYIENTNIKVKVTMPESSVVRHRANTDVRISGVVGRYFRLEHHGNGDAYISGKTDELDIEKIGNGAVKAQNLEAKLAKVRSAGNGDVIVNVTESLKGNGAGNGSIVQVGIGEIASFSGVIGNGSIYRAKK
jgi:hypothetical protein